MKRLKMAGMEHLLRVVRVFLILFHTWQAPKLKCVIVEGRLNTNTSVVL